MALFSRELLTGLCESISAKQTCNALKNAIEFWKPSEKVLHHSDRGIKYSSNVFHELLDKYNMKCSMSTTADPWSNACKRDSSENLRLCGSEVESIKLMKKQNRISLSISRSFIIGIAGNKVRRF